MNKKNIILVAGFLTFVFGVLSIVLMLVGARFIFIGWIDDSIGLLGGLLVRIIMVLAGVVMAIWAKTDWEKEDGIY